MALHVVHLIAPVAFGGGEALLVDLLSVPVADLRETVVTVGRAPAFTDALAGVGVASSGLGEVEVGSQRGGRRAELRTALGLLRPWRAEAARLAPDVVHAHGFPPSLLGALLSRAPGPRRIYTHHYERRPPGRVERAALTAVFRRYDAVTTVADHLSERMTAYFPGVAGGFGTLPIGLADRFFDADPDPEVRRRFPAEALVAVCVGRLIDTKNQALAVRALAEALPRADRPLGLLLVGTGPDGPALRALVADLGLGELVQFAGQVDRARMPSLLAGCDVGVLPSTTEASSLAAAELVAAGRPVLALDLPPMRESLGPAGVLVAPEGFAEGWLRLAREHQDLVPLARAQGERRRVGVVRQVWADAYRRLAA